MPCDNLTRFYSVHSPHEIRQQLCATLERMVVPNKLYPSGHKIQFQTVDKRQCPLTGEITIQELAGGDETRTCMVVFRRTKGDPIEFTRFYRAVSGQLSHMVLET